MRILFFVLLTVSLFSCGPKEWYHQQVNIPEQGWHMDTMAVFNSKVENLQSSVHLLLEVTNIDSYSYNNIWFFIDAVSPSGHKQRDTLEFILASDQGKWYGERVSGKGFKSTQPYKLNIKFPETGEYKYYVAQGMRDTVLQGLQAVGLRIIEVEEK